MKKILALVLALSLIFVLASCGRKLSGTYVLEGPMGNTKYEFKGKKVTLTVETILDDIVYSGEYKIAKTDDGKLEITFTFEDGGAAEYSKTRTFEKTKNGIKLNGLEYVKK